MSDTPTRSRGSAVPDPTPTLSLFTKYSVTSLLLLQYVPLALWQGYINHNQYLDTMTAMVAVGVLGSLLGERLVNPLHRRRHELAGWGWVTPNTSLLVTGIGLAALLVAPTLGIGTYAVQVGQAGRSSLAPLVTPLLVFVQIGVAMLYYCYMRGRISRRHLHLWLGSTVVVYAVNGLQRGITAQVAAYVLALLIVGVAVGAFKPRSIVIGVVIAALLWPTVFEVRNSVRARSGGQVYYGQEIDASQRLREDLQFQDAARLLGPLDIGQASLLTTVRYGLVPRALDSSRPEIRTGAALSGVFGRSTTSSSTLTLLGNAYALSGGWRGVFLVPLFLGAAVSALLTRPNPLTMSVVFVTGTALLWIESTWPDGLAGPLQALVSTLVAFTLAYVCHEAHQELVRRRPPAGVRALPTLDD